MSRNQGQLEGESGRRDDSGSMHSCGFISNAFLPCLACDETLDGGRKKVDESVEGKKKLQSVGGSSMKKKMSFTQSFKWRDGHENAVLSKCFWFVSRLITLKSLSMAIVYLTKYMLYSFV